MQRVDQRQGFLVSAVVHLMILMFFSSNPLRSPSEEEVSAIEPRPEERSRVFLPPPEVLRELAARPAEPIPAPTPRPQRPRDRISVGPPSSERAKGPILLRREDDLTAVPKGQPDAVPSPEPTPQPRRAERSPSSGSPGSNRSTKRAEAAKAPRPGGLRLPQLDDPFGPPTDRREGGGDDAGPSIASSLRDLDRRLETSGPRGVASGTGQQMGPLFFDPMGADFTVWLNRFKNEVYHNWIVPQAALMGFGGHVDLEFTVLRDGSMTNLRLLRSSGTASLDRAARNALLGSTFLPLPADYGPSNVTMKVTFYYGETPRGS